jgi:hypothetical protein
MTFTERALAAHIITQAEADAIENWIDENCNTETTVTVPKELHNLWERVSLFNFRGEQQ